MILFRHYPWSGCKVMMIWFDGVDLVVALKIVTSSQAKVTLKIGI